MLESAALSRGSAAAAAVAAADSSAARSERSAQTLDEALSELPVFCEWDDLALSEKLGEGGFGAVGDTPVPRGRRR